MNKDYFKNRIVGSVALVSFFVISIPILLKQSDQNSIENGIEEKTINADIVSPFEDLDVKENSKFKDPPRVANSLQKEDYLLEELNKTLENSVLTDGKLNKEKIGSESWLVQFFDFDTEKKADELYDILVLDGYSPTKILQLEDQLNRMMVRLGPFQNKQKASDLIKEIELVYQTKGILIKVVKKDE